MNFLAQVIATAGEAEIMDVKGKINDLERKVTSLDDEVKEYLENNYAKFAIFLEENHLSIKAKDLLSEVECLQSRINNQVKKELNGSINEIESYKTKLQETNTTLQIVKELLSIDELIKITEEEHVNKRYLEAAKCFKDLNELLETSIEVQKLAVYPSVTNYVMSLHEKCLCDSLVVWKNFIIWEEVVQKKSTTKRTLTIDNCDSKSDIIRVLLYYDYLDYELKLLSKKLFHSLLEPVIKYKTDLAISSNDGIWTIFLKYNEEALLVRSVEFPSCEIIDKLFQIFDALFKSLDVFISDEDTFVNRLGDHLETDFCEMFVEHCLYEAVPTKKTELIAFSNVVEKVEEFDKFLKSNGFIKSANSSLLDYVKNIDNLFVEKTCQTYLVKARNIFNEDLQNMVQVDSDVFGKEEHSADDSDLMLCENVLQRPNCYISASMKNLLKLIRDGLSEIQTSDNSSGVELFYTIRNIISLYCDLTPLKHNTLLKSIPQQAALFYNNCMFLAHELTLLGIERNRTLEEDVIVTFVDYIEPLRSLGTTIFNSQIDIQRKQLIEILDNSGITRLGEYKEFPATVQKSLGQCGRQLTLLQSVWHNILPTNVYCKTIGMLCNCVLEKLIDSVLLLTDITVDTASNLNESFAIMSNKVPQLFPDPKEIFRHVKRWSRFTELLKVLNGTLKDIDDQWSDGKGPLAQEFKPDQVKHLIRALFQHTTRRTALLTRIK